MPLQDGYYSIQQKINKVLDPSKAERSEGATAPAVNELSLDLDDKELLELKKSCEKEWGRKLPEYESRQDRIRKFWKGLHFESLSDQSKDIPLADNAVFEAVETYIPMATRQNPEPMVGSDGTVDGDRYATCWKKVLEGNSERLGMKLKMKQMVRNWLLSLLGVAKLGWDARVDDVAVEIVRVQKMTFDPESPVINGENTGEMVGETRTDKASTLKDRFPDKKDAIDKLTTGKDGTRIQYKQWCADDYVFFTLNEEILAKAKNPNWNYPKQVDSTDEFGKVSQVTESQPNILPYPQKPYVFLSPFNEGNSPMDSTSLVEQVMGLQRIVTKRGKQIDRNADRTNGAVVTTGKAFDKEQASKVAKAIEDGGNIHIPDATLNAADAVAHVSAPSLPQFVYQNQVDARQRMMDIFGTRGTSASQSSKEKTVGGKVILRQHDTDRIGGGVSEFLEQCAERIYWQMAQICCVYYDSAHFRRYLSEDDVIFLMREMRAGRRFSVTVKEGSMLPKDSLSRRQEAMELYGAGALDPLTLYERLEFPDPKESVKRLIAWKTNPQMLIGEVPQPMLAQPPTATGQQPNEMINVQPT